SARAKSAPAIKYPELKSFLKNQKSVHKSSQGLSAIYFTNTSR
ncbi:BgTH12-04220, partial [Blumeria graminis f. sp. triticale]